MQVTPKSSVLARLRRAEQGQDLIEYALLVGLLTVTIWAVVPYTGWLGAMSHIWSRVHHYMVVIGGG